MTRIRLLSRNKDFLADWNLDNRPPGASPTPFPQPPAPARAPNDFSHLPRIVVWGERITSPTIPRFFALDPDSIKYDMRPRVSGEPAPEPIVPTYVECDPPTTIGVL